MASKDESDPLKAIEDTQEELRKSIEKTRELAAKSQRLLDKHKKDLESE